MTFAEFLRFVQDPHQSVLPRPEGVLMKQTVGDEGVLLLEVTEDPDYLLVRGTSKSALAAVWLPASPDILYNTTEHLTPFISDIEEHKDNCRLIARLVQEMAMELSKTLAAAAEKWRKPKGFSDIESIPELMRSEAARYLLRGEKPAFNFYLLVMSDYVNLFSNHQIMTYLKTPDVWISESAALCSKDKRYRACAKNTFLKRSAVELLSQEETNRQVLGMLDTAKSREAKGFTIILDNPKATRVKFNCADFLSTTSNATRAATELLLNHVFHTEQIPSKKDREEFMSALSEAGADTEIIPFTNVSKVIIRSKTFPRQALAPAT